MALQSIGMEWVEYSDAVFHGMNPSATQVCETKKAFYAGALAIMAHMEQIGTDAITEKEGSEHLQSVSDELREFFEYTLSRDQERN